MKILQIITTLGGGGAEKMLWMLSDGLKKNGHDVTVLSLCAPPRDCAIPEKLHASGITVEYLNIKKYDPLLIWKLRKKIRAIAPDLVHSHLIHPNLLTRLACAPLKMPLVNTVHTAEKRRGKGFYFLLDRLTNKLAFSTAVSESTAAFHEKKCHLPQGSIKVIRNGLEPVIPASGEDCKKFFAPFAADGDFDKVIGCVGRLDAMKGYAVMMDRLDALADSIPANKNWLILILGDGPDRKKLEEKAASLNFRNLKVKFAGFRADAPSLMNAFDVFFTPSLCEGYGLAAAEAMSLGLPVVANRVDALSELCERYDGDAFLFDMAEDKDGKEMAEKLLAATKCRRTTGMVIMEKDEMVRTYAKLYHIIVKKVQKKA